MKLCAFPRKLLSARLIPTVFIGVIIGIIELFIELSFAALIFSGPLAGFIEYGVGMMLVATILIGLVVAFGSSFHSSIALPQDVPVAILALVSAGIMRQMIAAPPANGFATVVMAIVISALLTGFVFFLIGRFHLSVFARFIPFPVIGGFLAGTGFLLVQGALGVMVNLNINWYDVGILFSPVLAAKWVPGLIFGVALLLILRRTNHFLVMPVMVVGATVLFYLGILFSGQTFSAAVENGWLLAAQNLAVTWQPLSTDLIARVDWQVLLSQWDKIATVMFISVIGMLLNISGLELVVRRDFNLDRELKVAGIANFFGGLAGGAVGYHALSLSALANRIGGKSRAVGVLAAVVILASLVLGTSWFALVPRWVLGGLLLFLGLSFLVEWLYDAWFTMPHLDYALVVAILAVSATIGFLEGVVFGIVIAMVLFVINYSRVRVVNNALSGVTYRSAVDRSPAHRAFLREQGDKLMILQLQEYLFFGTAQRLLENLQKRVTDQAQPRLEFIVLDFRRVSGLDSSAIAIFTRLKQLLQAHHTKLVLTQLTPAMVAQLARGQVLGGHEKMVHWFDALDLGVEWCENELLRRAGYQIEHAETLETQFARYLSSPADIVKLKQYLEYRELPEWANFIHQGDPADALYFIETGSVAVELHMANGMRARLRTIRRGCVVGEVAMYTHGVRTASVKTLEPSTLYCLTNVALLRMEQDDPMIASALHKWIAAQLAERLTDNVRTLEAVMH